MYAQSEYIYLEVNQINQETLSEVFFSFSDFVAGPFMEGLE